MTRRTFVGFGTAAVGAAQNAPQRERPNLLMIMADQHRGDCLGSEGHPVVRTPNLDRLAREGARFAHAYSSTPTCTPARSALLTGLSPWRHGMLGYGRVADRYPFEKARALSEAGYWTACIGKNHFSPQRNAHGYRQALLDESGRAESVDFRSDYRSWFYAQAPSLDPDSTGIGWNDFRGRPYALPENLHPTAWTGDVARRFLETYRFSQPFFLKVSFARPHSPYDPPERLWRQYGEAAIPKAAVGKWASRNVARSDQTFDSWRGDLGEAQVRESRQGYYGSITFIDEQIGRILETLERTGQLERTLIVYFSDHGDMTGDHHLWRKSYAYEASARVPMIVRWPQGLIAAKRGSVLANPVELRDVLPTLLDAAGLSTQRELDGQSLLRTIATGKGREFIDLEHDICYHASNHWNALTDGRWKYIFHARDGEEQLFDLAKDPNETTDLAGATAHAPELKRWRERMIAHLAERGETWVKAGKLSMRPESQRYSPWFPKVTG
ncbi:MAG: arylsulfatase [Bryobacteraceae bacterium]